MTHDSIGLGEDGPTHQPIETLASCRATPNLLTLRPADGNETSGAYAVAIENRTRPSVVRLLLSRSMFFNIELFDLALAQPPKRRQPRGHLGGEGRTGRLRHPGR